jgi:DNA-binding HxlR family transcriptional regulator
VEYNLTPLGETLSVVIIQLEHWVVDNYEQVTDAQAMFDMIHAE